MNTPRVPSGCQSWNPKCDIASLALLRSTMGTFTLCHAEKVSSLEIYQVALFASHVVQFSSPVRITSFLAGRFLYTLISVGDIYH